MVVRQVRMPETLHRDRKIISQIQVRSDLRAGNDDCSLGISYWRKEYNAIKQQAERIGCQV